MAERFYIIDGMAQIFRCYYAPFQHLSSPTGEPTRATYVFVNMLLQLIRERKPDYLAMAMESKEGEVFRVEIDPAYKANREPPPEDLAPQIERILQIVTAQKIPVLSVPGFEADDLMATICRRLADHDIEIFLVTRDKDLEQLITDRVSLYDPGKNEVIGANELRATKGYWPDKAIEIQTLTGDSTDNVPGIKGVGPKKAADLIARYGTAEAVIAHADELTPAMRQNVKAFAGQIEKTRQLVTLRQDVPINLDLDACRCAGVDYAALQPILVELGFRQLLQRVSDQAAGKIASQAVAEQSPLTSSLSIPPPAETVSQPGRRSPSAGPVGASSGQGLLWSSDGMPFGADQEPRREQDQPEGTMPSSVSSESPSAIPKATGLFLSAKHDRTYTLVDTPGKLSILLEQLSKQPRFAFDTETTHLNPAWAELVGMSFSWQRNTGYYLPVRGIGLTLPLGSTLDALRPIMADPNIKKVGQNLKYDLVVMARHGMAVAGIEFDTMVASFVLDSSRQTHGMNALAHDLLGFDPIPISDLIGKGREQITFDQVDTARACEYAAEDADVTWSLYELFHDQLENSDLKKLFRDTEMPLVEVLAAMEAEGVRLDTAFLADMSRQLAVRLDDLTRRIHAAAGREFNIDSTRQLATVLFDELKLPVIRRTKTGASTDAETLDALVWQTDHPVPRLVKEYRELIKLKSTYVDTLPKMVCPATGRVHASFNQTVAVTGRLSSSDPNLQNIPIRTEIGREIRKAFVPGDADHVLLTADYSQIELRVLAHFCLDAALIEAFVADRDIHQFVASQVFNVPLDEVTREQRSQAKAVNFGIIYGQTAYGLSQTTGMAVSKAQDFIDRYFGRYPGIRVFIDQVISDARNHGFVQTILGRRRATPDINSRNSGMRAAAERFAVNTVIQGSAADMIKRAMINIHHRVACAHHPSRMLIQVHDELVFDVPRKVVESEAEFIRQEMCNALTLRVPIKVDLAWGDNWLEGK